MSDLRPSERWYAVQCIARKEPGAFQQLQAQGFRVFLPKLEKTVRHARRLRTVAAPLFPGYQFVTLDLERDRWRSVNGTIGVSSLVMAGSLPAPVPVGVVESLLAHVDCRGLVRLDVDLCVGQSVRVLSGPFANAVGRLVRLDGRERVRVLLDIMGGEVPALIDRAALAAA